MKRFYVVPVLASLVLAAGCGNDSLTEVDSRASVRFVNATTGMTGTGGFMTNGQFVSGSALTTGTVTQACSKVDAGSTSLGFGAANAEGTGMVGNPLMVTDNQPIEAGGYYTVVAAGPAASPTIFLFSNATTLQLASNQAAVRFANLASATGTTAFNYVFYLGGIGASTPLAIQPPFATPTAYEAVWSGDKKFSVLEIPGHSIIVENMPVTFAGGSANTMAVVPNATGGVQLIHIPSCS